MAGTTEKTLPRDVDFDFDEVAVDDDLKSTRVIEEQILGEMVEEWMTSKKKLL